ncbi:MAG: hypothetical protein Q4B70_01005 [Lachnospiraceae bacterium]|nr:hypothetical protein [Lachnospiraceae bacterium]
MAKVGLKYPVAAKLNEDGSYETGFVIAKAIKATVTANSNDVKLYADDGVSESDKSFRDGSLSLNVDDLTQKNYAELLGHTYKAAGTGEDAAPETVIASADDIAPYVGIGFYGAIKRNNVPSYQAKWLKKVQFSEPNDETDTKGETVNFQTPTIEGTVFQVENGAWKEQAEFSKEEDAKAWLNAKAGITTA